MKSRIDASGETMTRRITTGLAKIGLALRSQAWQGASQQGLTPTQGQILALLRGRKEPLRLSALAEQLGVTPATASDAVSALVDKGLVAKTRAPEDARALALGLTPGGRRLAARAAEWPDFLIEASESLTPEEQVSFLRSLIKMIRTLQTRGQIPIARMCVTCSHFQPHAHREAEAPHHCNFVDAPLGDPDLRIDCGDHAPASPTQAEATWNAFIHPSRLVRKEREGEPP